LTVSGRATNARTRAGGRSHDSEVLRVIPLPDRFENEADIEDIVALSDLLCVMLAQPDADTALDGTHRVMLIMPALVENVS
jgi:hypothetical protein